MALEGFAGRALARIMIPDFVRKGFGAKAALRTFRAAGGQIRTQDWLSWYREERGFFKYQPAMERLRPETPVPKAWFTEADLARPAAYRVFYEVEYTDIKTGRMETKWISQYRDQFRTAEEDIEEFERERRDIDYRSHQKITRYTLKGVQHMRGWEY